MHTQARARKKSTHLFLFLFLLYFSHLSLQTTRQSKYVSPTQVGVQVKKLLSQPRTPVPAPPPKLLEWLRLALQHRLIVCKGEMCDSRLDIINHRGSKHTHTSHHTLAHKLALAPTPNSSCWTGSQSWWVFGKSEFYLLKRNKYNTKQDREKN